MNNESKTELTTEIAIVGGGMVGLVTALILHKMLPERKIALVEAFPIEKDESLYQPSFDNRSTALSPSSINIFQQLGVWSMIAEHVTEIQEVQVSDKGHIGSASYRREDNQGQPLGFVVDNKWLGQKLADSLLDQVQQCELIELFAPALVSATQAVPSGYMLTLEEQGKIKSLTCELLVVADGSHSQVRAHLGIATRVRDYKQSAIVANVCFSQPHNGKAFERFTAEGPLALLPRGGSNGVEPQSSNPRTGAKDAALVWTHDKKNVKEIFELTDDAFVARLQKAFGFRLGRFEKIGRRYCYPLEAIFAQEQVRSSLVLLGNAAHFLHPVAGQGFNLALRDVYRLGQCLAKADAQLASLGDLSVLQRYISEQTLDQQLTQKLGDGFIELFSRQTPVLQVARNLGLSSLNVVSPLKRPFFKQMMGLGFGQRSG